MLIIMIGVCFVGDRWTYWPVLSWPMYARRDFPYPGDTADRCFLVVELEDRRGNTRRERVEMMGLLPVGWDVQLQQICEVAFAPEPGPQAQRTLLHFAQVYFRDEPVKAIAFYREVWDVEPAAIPPLDQANPRSTQLLGRFEAADVAGGGA